MKKADVQFLTADRLNLRFDEVINIDVSSRFSDVGMVDQSKVLVRPRTGKEVLSHMTPTPWVVKDFFWFTDDTGIKTGYVSKGWEVYKVTYQTPWRYLGRFETLATSSSLSPGLNGDYFIAAKKLYKYTGWVSYVQAYEFTDEYDNQADLYADFPTPEDDLFALLRDTQSVYYSDGGKWIPFSENYTYSAISLGNNPDSPATFNTVSLPSSWQIDATTGTNAPWLEQVGPGALASPAQYVWSYLLITSWVYAGKYAYIFDYKDSFFVTVSLWNATPILSWVTYSIFSKKGRYIQITNWVDDDKYYNGTAFEARYEGYIKSHIEKFADFYNGWPGVIRTFGNQSFTNIGDSVYVSDVSQPLWFNINDSIDLQKSSAVDDYFVWKNKMIAYGNNFTTFIDPNVSSGANRTTDFKNYWIVPGSCAEVLWDFWLLTYSGQIIPLSETVFGTIVEKKNIWAPVYRYLQTMKRNVTSCFDWRKYYVYWEDRNETGYTCVYDSLYEFWSVYTGIRPAKFIVEWESVYFVESGTGHLCKLQKNKVTDAEVVIDQVISSKDIDAGNVFITKWIGNFWMFMENKNQKFIVNISKRTNKDSFWKDYDFVVNEKKVDSIGLVGFDNVDYHSLVPQFINCPTDNDGGNILRWAIRNNGTNGFYLNQLQLWITLPDTQDITNVDL